MKKTMAGQRRLLLMAATAATVLGIVAAVLTWTEAALALYGVAGLAAFAWIVLWAGVLNDAVDAVRTDVRRTTATLTEIGDAVEEADAAVQPVLRRLMTEMREAIVAVERVPSASVELERVYDSLVTHSRPMPELGNWAMSPRTLVWFVDRISTTSATTIVECGSGSSTVWFATAFERRGGPGRIISLESSEEYAHETRARLAELGLSHRAEVIYAPLVETTVAGRDPHPWYDLTVLPDDLHTIDILFVDGPVGAIAPQVRYPGFPLLADRLGADSIVVLDDTGRRDEERIIRGWLAERPHGRRLTLAERLDRSAIFSVDVD